MTTASATIIYTLTDEAPALATASFLPVVRAFAAPAGAQCPPGVALPWIACAERRSIGMHLAHLMHEGRVCADGDDWVLA